MMRTARWLAGSGLVGVGLLLGGCPNGTPKPPAIVPTPPGMGEIWDKFDEFEAQLMKRARAMIGDADDYRIFATTLDYPIGTLLRLDKVIPIAECKLAAEPRSASAPSMFPDYKLSKSLAASLGLDSSVFSGVTELGASLKEGDSFTYRISDASVKVLNDSQLTELLTKVECTDAMRGQPVRLVRGQIMGTRDFVASASAVGALKGKVAKIAGFDVSAGVDNSTISIQDPQPRAFLQVMSLVSPPTNNKAATIATAASAAVIAAAAASAAGDAGSGKIFVQQDKTDDRDASAVVKGLQTNFAVAGAIEKLDTSKMPKSPEVRYFDDADRARAEKVAAELKRQGYATAAPVRLGLSAPKGQLEVWLPKNPAAATPAVQLRAK